MNLDSYPSVLFVGTYVNPLQGSRAASEDLAIQLADLNWKTFCTSRVLWAPGRLLDMLRTVWQRQNDFSLAVVDVYSGLAFRYVEAACWWLSRLKKPYILTLHGGQLPEFAGRNQERMRRLLNSAIAVTAPSRYLQQSMSPYREGIQMIPNAIYLSRYSNPARSQVRPKLVWLRSFHRIYNPVLAVDVVARLIPDFPDINLQMAGPDKDGSMAEVEAEICRRNLSAHIQIIGAVPKVHVPQFLSNADVFLNTTNVDNTPVSVVEAMACGLSIVSTDVGGLPYLLTHGQDSLLVPPGDAVAFSAAVGKILADPALAREFGENARNKAAECDWVKVLPQWTDLIESALDLSLETKAS